jgi:predicted enzyme related to lactoylglutathione lyase
MIFMMKKLNIICQITWVYTANLEQTSSFYEKDLGLKLVRDEGTARIFQVSTTAQIGVCTVFEDRAVEPKGGMITIVTNEVDEWYTQLTNKGIAINDPPHVLEKFNIYRFVLEDPNGYVIEIQQFLE